MANGYAPAEASEACGFGGTLRNETSVLRGPHLLVMIFRELHVLHECHVRLLIELAVLQPLLPPWQSQLASECVPNVITSSFMCVFIRDLRAQPNTVCAVRATFSLLST